MHWKIKPISKSISNLNSNVQNKEDLKIAQVATAAAAYALHADMQRWTCFVPSSASDLPSSHGYFVESIRYTNSYGVQIATRDGVSTMFVRRINSGTWSEWQELAQNSSLSKAVSQTNASPQSGESLFQLNGLKFCRARSSYGNGWVLEFRGTDSEGKDVRVGFDKTGGIYCYYDNTLQWNIKP